MTPSRLAYCVMHQADARMHADYTKRACGCACALLCCTARVPPRVVHAGACVLHFAPIPSHSFTLPWKTQTPVGITMHAAQHEQPGEQFECMHVGSVRR